MGNISTVVLTTPHADYSRDKAVEEGLRDLGFHPASTGDDESKTVWLLLDRKLNYYEHEKFGIDGLRDLVLALPWHRWAQPTHLEVLWSDDHTTEDDSFGGRVTPYAWNRETWALP